MKNTSILILCLLSASVGRAAQAVDPSLKPPADSTSQVADVYQDMIVVQRKAKDKAFDFLFSTYGAANLSGGPESIYSLNLDVGFAFSDHFEVYLNYVPYFITQDQSIKNVVANLDLANGEKAELVSPKPKAQYGVELLWLPAYGKDSWGPHHIVRSDTFFKLFLGVVDYDHVQGAKGVFSIGKTFFLSRYMNPRVAAGFGTQQTIVNDVKSSSNVGLLELGSVWYF